MVAKKNTTRAAALTVTADDIVNLFNRLLTLVADYNQQEGKTGVKTPAAKPSPKAAAEDEPEETYTLEEINGMKIVELRELAVELGLEEQKVKAGIIAELTENGHIVDDDDEEEDDEDDELEDEEEDDDEEADDEEGYSREELEEMTLAQLRKLAKEEGLTVPRGADQDALVELILGEDEDDEDDDEDEDESDDSDSDDDSEEITEDEIKAMSLKELIPLAKELEIKVTVPRTANTDAKKQKVYVKAILDSVAEEEE